MSCRRCRDRSRAPMTWSPALVRLESDSSQRPRVRACRPASRRGRADVRPRLSSNASGMTLVDGACCRPHRAGRSCTYLFGRHVLDDLEQRHLHRRAQPVGVRCRGRHQPDQHVGVRLLLASPALSRWALDPAGEQLLAEPRPRSDGSARDDDAAVIDQGTGDQASPSRTPIESAAGRPGVATSPVTSASSMNAAPTKCCSHARTSSWRRTSAIVSGRLVRPSETCRPFNQSSSTLTRMTSRGIRSLAIASWVAARARSTAGSPSDRTPYVNNEHGCGSGRTQHRRSSSRRRRVGDRTSRGARRTSAISSPASTTSTPVSRRSAADRPGRPGAPRRAAGTLDYIRCLTGDPGRADVSPTRRGPGSTEAVLA